MQLQLVKKVDEARGTKSFFFNIVDGYLSEEKLSWEPGQYIYITLPYLNYPDERGDTRHFTISSSPTEGDLIRITIRIRQESGYKKTLDELPIGSEVEGKGPQGTFLFDSKIEYNIFLAGGIGITPFRSIIKNVIDDKQKQKTNIHLIYSNSDNDFIFKKELDKWQEENEFIKVTYLDSSVSGHLDSKKLSSLVSNDDIKITYYAVGPNAFVNAMEEILEELSSSSAIKIPENNIKTEKFTGY